MNSMQAKLTSNPIYPLCNDTATVSFILRYV